MKYLMMFLLVFTSCGKESDSVVSARDPGVAATSPSPSQKQKTVNALTVSLLTDRPDCTANNNYQLVYVKSEKTFYSCSNLVWEATEIAAAPLATNLWIDPSSNLQWFIGSATNNYYFWNESCKNGWRKATVLELTESNHRGLMQRVKELGLPVTVWMQSLPEITTGVRFYKMDDEFVYNTVQVGTVLCVK